MTRELELWSLRTIFRAYFSFSYISLKNKIKHKADREITNRVIPSFATKLALKVIELPSDSNIVIASILGQKTSLSWLSNQFTWIVPFDNQRQMAERVLNHVRKQGNRAKESPSAGAQAAPALVV